jgi:hypothetical protein
MQEELLQPRKDVLSGLKLHDLPSGANVNKLSTSLSQLWQLPYTLSVGCSAMTSSPRCSTRYISILSVLYQCHRPAEGGQREQALHLAEPALASALHALGGGAGAVVLL